MASNIDIPDQRKRFLNYPEIKRGPDIPYRHDARKENPAMTGWILVIGAFLFESFGFIRKIIWSNTGFNSLRRIRPYIENVEPRYEPLVIPLEDPFADTNGAVEDVIVNGESHPKKAFEGYYSVADYTALYASGELTPTAVAKAILPLIRRDTSPPGVHSIAWFDSRVDIILAAAEASTRRWQEKRALGPLDGVPAAIKDDYDVEGYKTTLGSNNDYTTEVLPGQSLTNWCVQKLEDAGVVNLGKLSMHEFGLDTSGSNPNFGTPLNPYNPNYYTGGSSSGPAYAISAGLIPIALGSDGGGSIRIPSSFCSVFGLKPTHGRMSSKPGVNHSITASVNGPLAIDISSLALIYRTIGAPDAYSHFPIPSPHLSLSPNRPKLLGIPEGWFSRATPTIQNLCRTFLDRLVLKYGYQLVPITIPFLSEGQTAHAMTVLTDAATLVPVTKGLTAANKIMIGLGSVTPSTDYLLAQKLRNLLMQHLAYLWKEYPGLIIVTPTTACEGWKIKGGKGELQYGISDGDTTLKTMEYVWMANYLGTPAINVPVGFVDEEGVESGAEMGKYVEGRIPVGLMGMGEWGMEEELLGWGGDCEIVGVDRRARPPIWVDVVERAREEMKRRV